MRAASLRQPLRRRLEHDPLGHRDAAEQGQLLARHDTRIRVRQEPGLGEDELAHPRQVLDRRLAAELGELLAGGAVAELRLVAEGEERLVAAGRRACPCDLEHLVGRHVRALPAPRRPRERAVVADVPAELRQRDEDLRRVGDDASVAFLPERPRLGEQVVQRTVEHVHAAKTPVEVGRAVDVERQAPGPRTTTGSIPAARARAIVIAALPGMPKDGSTQRRVAQRQRAGAAVDGLDERNRVRAASHEPRRSTREVANGQSAMTITAPSSRPRVGERERDRRRVSFTGVLQHGMAAAQGGIRRHDEDAVHGRRLAARGEHRVEHLHHEPLALGRRQGGCEPRLGALERLLTGTIASTR